MNGQTNASYVMLVPEIRASESINQLHSIRTPNSEGEVIRDFDGEGRLLGVEILNAGQVLRPDVLEQAERL